MSLKNPKKVVSSALVFASVFFGSIIGAGITMISAPMSGRQLRNKIEGTFSIVKGNVNEHLDTASLIVIERSAQVITKSKINLKRINSSLSTVKDKIKNPFDK